MPLLAKKYFPRELYEVLKALAERELSTMEISRVAGVSHTFLLSVLPSLEDGGFVSVAKGQTDKRMRYAKLTDGGRYLLQALELYREALEANFTLLKTYLRTRPVKHRRGKTP